jgi:hypothetical protein
LNEEKTMSLDRVRKTTLACLVALGIGALGTTSASAAVLVTANLGTGGANDCTGLFGNAGGDNPDTICDVGHALSPSANVSPIIAKYDVDEGKDEGKWYTNSAFSSITGGDEFTFINNGGNPETGTWTYTPGDDDPAVRYWVAKGGNAGFLLHWMVDQTALEVGGACAGVKYTLACLNQAQSVTSGTWSTAAGGLSHLSWYDTSGPQPPEEEVPEPGVLLLIGAGLLGMRFARGRTST